jgi:hypothetical protein
VSDVVRDAALFADWFEAMSRKVLTTITSRKKSSIVADLLGLNHVSARERKRFKDHA